MSPTAPSNIILNMCLINWEKFIGSGGISSSVCLSTNVSKGRSIGALNMDMHNFSSPWGYLSQSKFDYMIKSSNEYLICILYKISRGKKV